MRLVLLLFLLLLSPSSFACEDKMPCEMNSMAIFLPDAERIPAPNIHIERIIYQTEAGFVDNKVSTEQVFELVDALNNISIKSFKESKTAFELLVQFKLTPSSEAECILHTTGREQEKDMLNSFYDAASKLTKYRSKKDEVEVVMHYIITPVVSE